LYFRRINIQSAVAPITMWNRGYTTTLTPRHRQQPPPGQKYRPDQCRQQNPIPALNPAPERPLHFANPSPTGRRIQPRFSFANPSPGGARGHQGLLHIRCLVWYAVGVCFRAVTTRHVTQSQHAPHTDQTPGSLTALQQQTPHQKRHAQEEIGRRSAVSLPLMCRTFSIGPRAIRNKTYPLPEILEAFIYGNLILVRHSNDYVSVYAHANEISVKRGDQIKRGDVIGNPGQTGNVSTPQLYFEIRKGTMPVDPIPLVAMRSSQTKQGRG
jgi:hypothetical protein